jgi:uridine kinase
MTPFLVAIAGGSGSGKSVLTQSIATTFGVDRVATLAHDRYYRDRQDLLPIERSRLNYDVPDALDQALFREHLAALRLGQPIVPPVYCFVTHRRDGWGTPIGPREIVLVEGILLFHDPDIRNAFDVRIFVDAPDDVRLRRRIARDTCERGRTPDSVVAQCRGTVFPAHTRYVEPTKALADLVLLNAGRLEPVVEVATAVIRSQLARRRGGLDMARAA